MGVGAAKGAFQELMNSIASFGKFLPYCGLSLDQYGRVVSALFCPIFGLHSYSRMPDTRFRIYLKAFFGDTLTGMSGPLSVPFALAALFVSSHGQKVLYGCLAALCALFASYRVWRNEREVS